MVARKALRTNPDYPLVVPSFTGLFLGFIFFVLTFTPSLVPQPPIFRKNWMVTQDDQT